MRSSDISLDFYEFCKMPPIFFFFFCTIRILYLFLKSSINPFVDTSLTFSGSSCSLFSTSTCFDLFDLTFLFRFISLSSKSDFFLPDQQYQFCLLNLLILMWLQNYLPLT